MQEIRDAMEVLHSGNLTMGQKTKEYEQAFADYVGTKYAVACNSGSSANLLMVAAYTLKYGVGTVIVPAVGWSTSYAPFQQHGWKLVFVDIDDSLNYNVAQLWKAVETQDDPLILAINLLG
jgi:CDP-6-deoxy-D-xylo-4-hexulose-3-dehydrase